MKTTTKSGPLSIITGYLGGLNNGRLILWCYLIWYCVVLVRYFDPSPRLWLTSLGLSGIIGFALYISTTAAGGEKVKLGFWQTFRLFLMPFCVFELFSPGEGQGICPHFSHHNPERSCSPWATALPSQSVIRRSITESCARTIPSAAATSLVVSLS